MKAKLISLGQLLIVLAVCGLIALICTGCGGGNDDDDDNDDDFSAEADDDYGYGPPPASSFPLGLNPPNGAAFDDVFFKDYGTNPFIDTEGRPLFDVWYGCRYRLLFRHAAISPRWSPSSAGSCGVEEFINAFDYNYDPPLHEAFAIHIEGTPSKFGEGKRLQLLRIGIQGQVVPTEDRKDAVLTFVIDVSGSMAMENRLGLVKRSLRLLVEQLRPGDEVGIVIYGSRAKSCCRTRALKSAGES